MNLSKKINSLFFILIAVAIVLLLLPKNMLYGGWNWTILGYSMLVIIFIIVPILLISSIIYDLKGKNWKLLLLRTASLVLGVIIWILHKYILKY